MITMSRLIGHPYTSHRRSATYEFLPYDFVINLDFQYRLSIRIALRWFSHTLSARLQNGKEKQTARNLHVHQSEFRHPPMKYQSIKQIDVPKGRDGKHKQIVAQLLSDIEQLEVDRALKIPLEALPDSKENIRSALNRATRQRGIEVATSSDAEFLYIWRTSDTAS